MPNPAFHDVLIAGAGPVGLLLACELGLAGCSVLVLEQATNPHSPLKKLPFGRRGLNVATIETFDRRSLLQPLEERVAGSSSFSRGATPGWMQQGKRRAAGHFAGIQFFQDRIDTAAWPWRLPTPTEFLAADMASVEDVLASRALELGATIRRGCGVEGLEQSDNSVVVHAAGESFRGGWLVGCDAGRSAVRKAAGIGFAGTEPEFTGYSALVILADSEGLRPGRHYTPTGMYMFNPPGAITIADFDGGAFHRTDPITREHLQGVLRKVSGSEVAILALDHATTWTDRAFQATDYRKGRVLLAGDAAHIHSPLGGQGLNLGLGDAMNLGWKLAATISGGAQPDLLDTYYSERHPIGAQILDWSRAQVALMRPNQSSRALRAIMRDLAETPNGATYFAQQTSGIGVRYDLGGESMLVGRSAPDFHLGDGTRLSERLRAGRGLLLDFSADARLRELTGRYPGRIDYVASTNANDMGLRALMVRPDGVVVWSSNRPGIPEATRTADRWFGRSATSQR
jgi:2-polyprenyl-6-methoxyphenol hydroxylase-like FAD-dependent oxidoreductase